LEICVMGKTKDELADACTRCGSFCCTYYALPLENPENQEDFDDFRWFLMHYGNFIYKDAGDWYLNVASPCRHLSADGRCTAYDARPAICRKHGHDEDEECEFFGGYEFEETLCSVEEVEAYAVRILGLGRDDVKGWFICQDDAFWKALADKGP